MKIPLYLEYTSPAPDYIRSRDGDKPNSDWEKWVLPLGNSHFGALLLGRTESDRIQITENSVATPYVKDSDQTKENGDTRVFRDIEFEFGHSAPVRYRRSLSLDSAVASVSYIYSGTEYEREYFLSYPDNVLAMRFTASKSGKLSFSIEPKISFCEDYSAEHVDKYDRTDEVFSSHTDIVMRDISAHYGIKYEGRLRVKAYGGKITNANGKITVRGAESAEIFFTCGTNYRMESRVFMEGEDEKKLSAYSDPSDDVLKTLNAACAKGYNALRTAHIDDYSKLFGRVRFSVGGKYRGIPTNELIEMYRSSESSRYLEELIFQYGRYLLISSSRKGGYPANIQGTWCTYDSSPRGCEYRHNIHVQMNYWPSHVANLAECFEAYDDYAAAYMPLARKNADTYMLQNYPERFPRRGACGWTIGTEASLYSVSTPHTQKLPGVGIGALTALLFWQHYDFTRNKKYLQETAYPYLLEMSRFLLLTLTEYDGKMLAGFSYSPEQHSSGKPYITNGSSFDQQMIYENFEKTLQAAKILRITPKDEPLLEKIEKTLPLLDPIIIGEGRYIKEFREEKYYGEIGEKKHRHVSQLMALYPGTTISRKTPDWLDSAKNTLNLRGDKSTGWAVAHRFCLWARTGDEDRAYDLYKGFIKNNILPNLWCSHPPFRIDGNFGATAGVCEMLLQSGTGAIEILPALPDNWRNGSFAGLCARGGFIVDCEWENRRIKEIYVTSTVGGVCRLQFRGANRAALDNIEFSVDGDLMFFPTIKGETLHITVQW